MDQWRDSSIKVSHSMISFMYHIIYICIYIYIQGLNQRLSGNHIPHYNIEYIYMRASHIMLPIIWIYSIIQFPSKLGLVSFGPTHSASKGSSNGQEFHLHTITDAGLVYWANPLRRLQPSWEQDSITLTRARLIEIFFHHCSRKWLGT